MKKQQQQKHKITILSKSALTMLIKLYANVVSKDPNKPW